jgi:hypothetical protein
LSSELGQVLVLAPVLVLVPVRLLALLESVLVP